MTRKQQAQEAAVGLRSMHPATKVASGLKPIWVLHNMAWSCRHRSRLAALALCMPPHKAQCTCMRLQVKPALHLQGTSWSMGIKHGTSQLSLQMADTNT